MKKYALLFLTFIFLSSFSARAQDTIYYDNQGEKVAAKELAEKFTVVTYGEKKGIEATERDYTSSGQITTESFYSNYKEKVLEGTQTNWNKHAQIRSQQNYRKGKWHGEYISYWPNGSMKRKDHYKKGEFKKGKVWNSTGVQVTYYPLIERAEFPGGQEALASFLKANISNLNSKKGKIVVKFVVDKTGEVTKAEIMKSDLPELNEEALRIVASMPKWKPGKHDGEIVSIFYALPLVFQ